MPFQMVWIVFVEITHGAISSENVREIIDFIPDGRSPQTQYLIYQTATCSSTTFVVKYCMDALPHQNIIYNKEAIYFTSKN